MDFRTLPIQVLLLSVALFCTGNLITQECPPGKHVFTNCTNPCIYNGSITVCQSKPNSQCVPDYCGACVTRFYDDNKTEVHCEIESGIICEQKTHIINCRNGFLIYMTEANFGRTSREKCRHPYSIERLHNNTNCRAPTSLQVMQKLCNGRQSCTITVENEMFGADPCYGIYKYLEFDFKCVSRDEINLNNRNTPDIRTIGCLLLLCILSRKP
ncbi:L-rhamnose-binding lectin CSL1-like isoform X2 [Saccostrea echinata]|uniref:L-rhamnose-binding lectin CSL1-like isoform X2 n=1 Tax=Saccostrea echinata TaxID=191078 RepID=UPI002A7F4AF3|nr:L-rhamnose-binding lectin CSL1-like isoform X2 [Saccostrea echinata]